MSTVTLEPNEIQDLTQARQPATQLRKLLSYGFARARIERGRVILERPHFEAVCAGVKKESESTPTVKKVI